MSSSTEVRVLAISRTCLFAVLFIAIVGFYLPHYLGFLDDTLHRDWRAIGIMPLIIGAIVALRCVFAFAWTGLGTPAPFDAPRRLVVTGFYRYVRNPMYVGFALFLIGEFLLFSPNLRGALVYLAAYALVLTIFVMTYEEPTLRRKFPEDYRQYCQSVPRFLPRLTPWQPPTAKAATN